MSKCSVGQSAYLIYQANGQTNVHEDMMMVERVSIDEIGYHYSLVNGDEDIIDWCREEDVFGNLQDAIEECIERNLTILEDK